MESQSVTYQAATEICDVLPFLLPAHTAKAVDRTLKLLLDNAKAGNDVEIEVLDLLNEHEHTRGWLQDRLSGQNASRTERGFSSLPGDSTTSIPGTKLYRCPVDGCTRIWFMSRAGQKIPQCPDHQVPFVEATTA